MIVPSVNISALLFGYHIGLDMAKQMQQTLAAGISIIRSAMLQSTSTAENS